MPRPTLPLSLPVRILLDVHASQIGPMQVNKGCRWCEIVMIAGLVSGEHAGSCRVKPIAGEGRQSSTETRLPKIRTYNIDAAS